MSKKPTMRPNNKGWTVKLNFWSMEKYMHEFSSEWARHRIMGKATNIGTGNAKMFTDAGQLLSLLSKWNIERFKALKAAQK